MKTTPDINENLQCTKSPVARWFRRLQSDYVLSVARIFFLVAAVGSLIVVIGGLVFVLFLQTQTWQSPSQEPVPAVSATPHKPLDLDSLSAHLAPPKNIAIHVKQINGPLKRNTIVGYFTADTPNGLAPYPEDVLILGGEDAILFKRIEVRLDRGRDKRTGLVPTTELIEQINNQMKILTAPRSRKFQLRAAARDKYGNVSAPANVTFSLTYGSAPTAQAELRLTDYQGVARDIALIVDPSRTPAYFKAYKRALRVPGECGASGNDTHFASDARRAFDGVKSKLTAANVEAFYAGLCSSWRKARSDEKAANASAVEARKLVMARNAEARAQAELAATAASLGRKVALGVVGSAFVTFLIISFLLAFLAIENHTKSVREVMEALLDTKKNSDENTDSREAST